MFRKIRNRLVTRENLLALALAVALALILMFSIDTSPTWIYQGF